MASNVAFGEPCASIREQILPFAFEGFVLGGVNQCWVVLDDQLLSNICFEATAPFS